MAGRGAAAARALRGPFKKYIDDLLAVVKKPVRSGSVRPWETGRYGDLMSRPGRQGLQMDHIPSFAAQRRAAEEALGRPLTRAEQNALRRSAPALAVPEDLHRTRSRTYGGRNQPNVVAQDASDLTGAVDRDVARYHEALTEQGYSPEQIAEIHQQLKGRQ